MNVMKFGIAFLLLFFGVVGYSQRQKVENYRRFDQRVMHFGFMMGANLSSARTYQKLDAYSNYHLVSLQNIPQPGAQVGVLTTIKLGIPIFRLRFIPTISFREELFKYKLLMFGGTIDKPYMNEERVGHVNLDFPLMLQLRTLRVNNFAAYVLGGFQYSLDLQSQERATQSDVDPFLKFKKHDYQFQVGGGVEFFMPFFKMGLEVKMSQSFKNAFINDNTFISNPIDHIIPRTWWFSVIFEG